MAESPLGLVLDGSDFAPAMRELRSAFDERSRYPRPAYRAVKAIDRWLGRRR